MFFFFSDLWCNIRSCGFLFIWSSGFGLQAQLDLDEFDSWESGMKPEFKIYLSRRVFGENWRSDQIIFSDRNQSCNFAVRVTAPTSALKVRLPAPVGRGRARQNALENLSRSSEISGGGEIEQVRFRSRRVLVYFQVLTEKKRNFEIKIRNRTK